MVAFDRILKAKSKKNKREEVLNGVSYEGRPMLTIFFSFLCIFLSSSPSLSKKLKRVSCVTVGAGTLFLV